MKTANVQINPALNSSTLRKPSRAQYAYKSRPYKTVSVTCLDLARLLDWCDHSLMINSDASINRIQDILWYREAYEAASLDLEHAL